MVRVWLVGLSIYLSKAQVSVVTVFRSAFNCVVSKRLRRSNPPSTPPLSVLLSFSLSRWSQPWRRLERVCSLRMHMIHAQNELHGWFKKYPAAKATCFWKTAEKTVAK